MDETYKPKPYWYSANHSRNKKPKKISGCDEKFQNAAEHFNNFSIMVLALILCQYHNNTTLAPRRYLANTHLVGYFLPINYWKSLCI